MKREGYRAHALTFDFKGIAAGELTAARRIAKAANAEQRVVHLPDLREAGDIRDASFPGLPSTYIPMRNAVFYSLAASVAEELRSDCIVGGHNRGDLRLFRDVSPRFFSNLEKAFWAGSRILARKKLRIVRPLARKTKPQVVRLAASLGVPLELTWSCHREGTTHCWRCDGCRSRAASFERAGIPDPIVKRV